MQMLLARAFGLSAGGGEEALRPKARGAAGYGVICCLVNYYFSNG